MRVKKRGRKKKVCRVLWGSSRCYQNQFNSLCFVGLSSIYSQNNIFFPSVLAQTFSLHDMTIFSPSKAITSFHQPYANVPINHLSLSLSLSEGKKEVNNRKEEGVTWLDTVYNIKSWAQCIFIKASQHINRWVWTLEYIFNQNNDGLNSTLIELISDILHQQSNIPFHQFPS